MRELANCVLLLSLRVSETNEAIHKSKLWFELLRILRILAMTGCVKIKTKNVKLYKMQNYNKEIKITGDKSAPSVDLHF